MYTRMKRICVLLFSFFVFIASVQAGPRVLSNSILKKAQGEFVVRENYTLSGESIKLPRDLKLVFSGGTINDGTIIGDNNSIEFRQNQPAFGLDITIEGSWNVQEIKDSWFEFDSSPDFISNRIISNMLSFSNDSTFCHISFLEDRTYYFELPYKGRPDIGNMVSYKIVDGKKKRSYSEAYNDEYSFLRIFTIPSNTHVTVNSTLKMLPTNVGAYFVFWEYGKENITVDGSGTIAGDNDWHRYDSPFAGKFYYGEMGFIFRCFGCKNFTFKDITLSDAFGDCLIYTGSQFSNEKNTRWASELTLENVKILNARRNGVAIGARDVIIRNCHFEGCGSDEVKGTAPRSAIDFEPDGIQRYPEIGNQNVLMENCSFKNNHFDVASYLNNLNNYGRIATTIRNCSFVSPIKIQGTYWMRFENCRIPFIWNSKDESSTLLYSRHLEFINCEFGRFDNNVSNITARKRNKFTDCSFNTSKQ